MFEYCSTGDGTTLGNPPRNAIAGPKHKMAALAARRYVCCVPLDAEKKEGEEAEKKEGEEEPKKETNATEESKPEVKPKKVHA